MYSFDTDITTRSLSTKATNELVRRCREFNMDATASIKSRDPDGFRYISLSFKTPEDMTAYILKYGKTI